LPELRGRRGGGGSPRIRVFRRRAGAASGKRGISSPEGLLMVVAGSEIGIITTIERAGRGENARLCMGEKVRRGGEDRVAIGTCGQSPRV